MCAETRSFLSDDPLFLSGDERTARNWAPAPARVREVADGVFWFRMPLPFALDHVNLWALKDHDGWTLVDTGVADDVTRALWEQLFAGPLGGFPVRRLICTHFHPDHMGLAGWLTERFSIPLITTDAEWRSALRYWHSETPDDFAGKTEYYRRAGFGADFLEHISDINNSYRPHISPPPPAIERIGDGDSIEIGGRNWLVMTCGGHSPEHACLWCPDAGVLIAGDQMLPRISPAIGVWAQEPDANPLALFLSSLGRFEVLPEETMVLPSHDQPFRTLRSRCAALQIHHQERLAKTLESCREPAVATQVLRSLFSRQLDDVQASFATAETLAHLNYLISLDKVRRFLDDAGMWRYLAI